MKTKKSFMGTASRLGLQRETEYGMRNTDLNEVVSPQQIGSQKKKHLGFRNFASP